MKKVGAAPEGYAADQESEVATLRKVAAIRQQSEVGTVSKVAAASEKTV